MCTYDFRIDYHGIHESNIINWTLNQTRTVSIAKMIEILWNNAKSTVVDYV